MRRLARIPKLFLLLLPVAVAALALPRVLVYLESKEEAVLTERIPEPWEADYMLLIGRKPEKKYESDDLPHRNSPIALYQKRNDAWVKQTEELLCRSTTTNERPPQPKEISSSAEGKRLFGHKSVPPGVYTITEDVWRDGWNRCFLISDWGRTDGSIALSSPQVLRHASLGRKEHGTPFVKIGEVEQTYMQKRESYLHPTITQYWSYHDSNGCINLHGSNDRDSEKEYDWDRFLDWLDSRSIDPRKPYGLPLIITDAAAVIDSETGKLSEQLPLRFYEEIP